MDVPFEPGAATSHHLARGAALDRPPSAQMQALTEGKACYIEPMEILLQIAGSVLTYVQKRLQ